MQQGKLGVVLLLAAGIFVLAANGVVVAAAYGSEITPERTSMPHRAPAFRSTVATAAQDPAAVEATLVIERPARRLIQQGLRNEGFDAGPPDGLFGPRTRGAIRRWQESRGLPATGYLDGTQAQMLRAAGDPRPAVTEERPAVPAQAPESSTVPAQTGPNCDQWNTEGFFESVTVSTVTACLAAGADLDTRDEDGLTPLHWAASTSGDAAVIEALLTAGADLEARDGGGAMPLHKAARNNENPAVIRVLLAAGADVEARADEGWTPLHAAGAGSGNPAVVRALLAAGASPGAQTERRATPLRLAARYNADAAVLKALLDSRADAGLEDRRTARDDVQTLLGSFLVLNRNPNLAIVEALLAAGTDWAAADAVSLLGEGNFFRNGGSPAVLQVLLDAGFDPIGNPGPTSIPVLHRAAQYTS